MSNDVTKSDWLLCPACGNKTRTKLRQDTTLTNFPMFCPKCKREILVNVHHIGLIWRRVKPMQHR